MSLNKLPKRAMRYWETYTLAFVDYIKAFDSLKHVHIWDALRSQGVHLKYIRIINKYIQGIKCKTPLTKTILGCTRTCIQKINWGAFEININGPT